MVKLIPEEEVAGKRNKFGYKIPDVAIDKEMYIKIKYGMLKMFIEDVMYIPRKCGAYEIITKSGHMYIGSTKNLYNRLSVHIREQRSHTSLNIIEPIDHIYIYVTESYIDAKILEHCLIKDLNPRLNVDK